MCRIKSPRCNANNVRIVRHIQAPNNEFSYWFIIAIYQMQLYFANNGKLITIQFWYGNKCGLHACVASWSLSLRNFLSNAISSMKIPASSRTKIRSPDKCWSVNNKWHVPCQCENDRIADSRQREISTKKSAMIHRWYSRRFLQLPSMPARLEIQQWHRIEFEIRMVAAPECE